MLFLSVILNCSAILFPRLQNGDNAMSPLFLSEDQIVWLGNLLNSNCLVHYEYIGVIIFHIIL